jgi:hypothetical protein
MNRKRETLGLEVHEVTTTIHKKFYSSHVVYSVSPRAHYSLFESDTDGAYLPESERTKIKDPHLVFTYIFMSAHLILLYKKSLIINPQNVFCVLVMQSDMHANCQNIRIVGTKFLCSNDIRYSALCSLWSQKLQWNYSSLM